MANRLGRQNVCVRDAMDRLLIPVLSVSSYGLGYAQCRTRVVANDTAIWSHRLADSGHFPFHILFHSQITL
jgi:hypothetical protein